MALLLRLQKEQGMGLLMITDDLAVVAEMAQRVALSEPLLRDIAGRQVACHEV